MAVTLHEDQYTFLATFRALLLRKRNISDKSCRENKNIHFMFRAGQATDDNTTLARCTLDTKGYKHTLRIHNTYSFSTARVAARMRLNVTLCVYCLSGICQVGSLTKQKLFSYTSLIYRFSILGRPAVENQARSQANPCVIFAVQVAPGQASL